MPQAKDFDDGLRGPSHQERSALADFARRNDHAQRELERFIRSLMHGDRVACRDQVRNALAESRDARAVLESLIWPACSVIDGWSRRDQIGAVHQHCATMLLSQLVQRLEAALPRRGARCRLVLVASGPKPLEEMAAELFAGIAEADGFDVLFVGGGAESDDLFQAISERTPDFVVSYAAAGADAARLRRLLKALKDQDPVPGLQIGVGGGVFSRAPGLAEEMGIDFSADSPFDLLAELGRVADLPPARAARPRAA